VRKAEEVEATRFVDSAIASMRWVEPDEPGFLRVQCKAVLRESFRKHVHDATSIGLVAEADDEVVSVAHEESSSSQPRLDYHLKPRVEHLVEVDVREQGGDDSSLRSTGLGMRQHPVLLHSRVQKATYQ